MGCHSCPPQKYITDSRSCPRRLSAHCFASTMWVMAMLLRFARARRDLHVPGLFEWSGHARFSCQVAVLYMLTSSQAHQQCSQSNTVSSSSITAFCNARTWSPIVYVVAAANAMHPYCSLLAEQPKSLSYRQRIHTIVFLFHLLQYLAYLLLRLQVAV